MSDPSTSDIVKSNLYNATEFERNWWNTSNAETKLKLVESLDFRDINASQYEIASEHAYQQEHTAKINQLVKTNYDSLPSSIQSFVTEALIVTGELPSPSDLTIGIGNEFLIFDGEAIAIECDRCDEEFLSEEQFDDHKEYDHGDAAKDETEEAEDSFQSLMDDTTTKEELQEARKLLAENKEMPDFGRDIIFNGKDLPTPTTTVPTAQGEQGYNANPNEGLYDYPDFKTGDSSDRVALEGAGEDGMAEPTKITTDDTDQDVDYDSVVTHGDIEMVKLDDKNDDGDYLDDVDFSEESIDYVYPTLAREEFKEEKDPFLSDYEDRDIESEDEVVETQIIDRKLSGTNVQGIAQELVMVYGVSIEEALEKVNSVEVSTNDMVANTFFGKKYSECSEGEIQELKLFSGNDD